VSELTEKDISNVVVQWTKLTIVFLKTNSFLTCSLFPDVCLGVSCTYGSKCVLDATSGISHMCACNSICRQYYDPVCGSDGQTYNNECLMNVSRCSTNRAITVVSRGKCSGGNFIVVRLCCRTEILTGGTLKGGLSKGDSQRGTLKGGLSKGDSQRGTLKEGLSKRDSQRGTLKGGLSKGDSQWGTLKGGLSGGGGGATPLSSQYDIVISLYIDGVTSSIIRPMRKMTQSGGGLVPISSEQVSFTSLRTHAWRSCEKSRSTLRVLRFYPTGKVDRMGRD
jgi:hypothetical protein